MWLILFFIIIIAVMFIYKKEHIITYFPIFIALIEILPFWLIPNNESADIKLSYIVSMAILLIFIIIISSKKYKILTKKSLKLTIIFILLMLLANYNSTDKYYTFKNIGKFSTVLLSYSVAASYFYYNSMKYKELIKSTIIACALYMLNIFFCSIFHLGINASYTKMSFVFLGGMDYFHLFPLIYSIVFFQFSNIKEKNYKISQTILTITVILTMLLIGKRTYIYLISFGVLYNLIKDKRKAIIYTILIGLILLIFPIVINLVNIQFFEARTPFKRNPFEEGRFLEYGAYYKEIIHGEDPYVILFGKELFNSRGQFFKHSNFIIDDDRVLHSDYTNILFGTGLVGATVYLILLLSLIVNMKKQKGNNNLELNKYKTGYYSILISLIVNGFSDGILGFSNRFFPFFLMGAVFGLLKSIQKKQELNIINKVTLKY